MISSTYRAMRAVLLFARTDSKIMPLNRYRSSREVVSAVLSMYKQHAFVRTVKELRQQAARVVWHEALKAEEDAVEALYVQHLMACELPVPVSARAVREACTALHDMPIGAYERVGLSCGTCCQLKRAMRYHFCEGPNLCRACAASVAGAAVYVVVSAAVCTLRAYERCWHVHVSWNIPRFCS
jgi:hypothetical protein